VKEKGEVGEKRKSRERRRIIDSDALSHAFAPNIPSHPPTPPFALSSQASRLLRAHPAVVLAAVRQRGDALALADPVFRGHRPTVLAAVRRDGAALRFASATLRDDYEVAEGAQTGPLEFRGQRLKHEKTHPLAQSSFKSPRRCVCV
jgi:hypothetical protein